MATGLEFKEFIEDQLSDLEGISFRKMMGEYLVYYKGKYIAALCDDRFLIKPFAGADDILPSVKYEKPYDGAKDMLLVDGAEHGVSFLVDQERYIAHVKKFLSVTLGFTLGKD